MNYVDTILFRSVTLKPNKMNKNIRLNLKDHLIEQDYDVFEISDYKNNRIEAENTGTAAIYDVNFQTCPRNEVDLSARGHRSIIISSTSLISSQARP